MPTVDTALQLLQTAYTALNAAREHATASADIESKRLIGAAYDQMAALREAVVRVTDENEQLKQQIARLENPAKPKIRQVGAVNYYFVGENGPYCQPCYDGELEKLVALSPAEACSGNGVRRNCPVCHQTFYEKKIDHTETYTRRSYGPWG